MQVQAVRQGHLNGNCFQIKFSCFFETTGIGHRRLDPINGQFQDQFNGPRINSHLFHHHNQRRNGQSDPTLLRNAGAQLWESTRCHSTLSLRILI